MSIDTEYLRRCVDTLESAFSALTSDDLEEIGYDIYRAACVKEFELVLEQSGRLLKKRLRPWFASNRQADRLTFKDVFRHAAKHGLLPVDACERWLEVPRQPQRHRARLRRGLRGNHPAASADLHQGRPNADRRD